ALAGQGWTVTWALGHLAELAPPDAYGEEYKKWRLESLPILPGRFKVRVNHKTRDQFDVVKGLMRDPSVTEVVNACDAGREGELIFAYLYGLTGCNKPVRRLWISSLTPEAIREGFDALRDGSSMRPLEDAARSRSESDWIVGMNATRAYSVRFGRPGNVLSVGRVQTPTLRLIVDREKEIENFKPEKFWTVHARVAQALYEEKKLITYPRTSSRYLSRDMVGGLEKRVEAAGALPKLALFAEKLLGQQKLPISKRIVDDSKVTDHHAIVPTGKKSPGGLPPDETKVYGLVARRFLAVFFPAARFENTTVVTEVRKETFLSRGRVVLEAGWRGLYPDGGGGGEEREAPVLAPIEGGEGGGVGK